MSCTRGMTELLEIWLQFIARDEGRHLLAALRLHAEQEEACNGSLPFILDLDEACALELAALNPESLHLLLNDTDALCTATTEVLINQGLISPRTRAWLRVQFAQMHATSLETLESSAAAHGNLVASFTGVVQALSTSMHQVYSRSFKCMGCACLVQAMAGQEPTCSNSCVSGWEEQMEGRVLVPVQEIWLSDLSCSVPGSDPYYARRQSMRATLVDDLVGCSAVCLGAPVSVVGRVSCLEQGGGAWRRKAFGVTSMYVLSLKPAEIHAPWLSVELLQGLQPSTPLIHPLLALRPSSSLNGGGDDEANTHAVNAANARATALGQGSGSPLLAAHPDAPLQSLANALMEAQGCYLDPTLAIALLISSAASGLGAQQLQLRDAVRAAAASGTSSGAAPATSSASIAHSMGLAPACTIESVFAAAVDTSTTQRLPPTGPATQPVGRERCSINLLLWHEANDPCAARALRASAALLSPHSLAPGSSAATNQDLLQPRVEKLAAQTDASTAESVLKVTNSSLIQANCGVLVLDGSTFVGQGIPSSKAHAQQLHTALSAGSITLDKQRPPVQVPVLATVWATSAAPAPGPSCSATTTFMPDTFNLVLRHEMDDATAARCVLGAGEDVRQVDDDDDLWDASSVGEEQGGERVGVERGTGSVRVGEREGVRVSGDENDDEGRVIEDVGLMGGWADADPMDVEREGEGDDDVSEVMGGLFGSLRGSFGVHRGPKVATMRADHTAANAAARKAAAAAAAEHKAHKAAEAVERAERKQAAAERKKAAAEAAESVAMWRGALQHHMGLVAALDVPSLSGEAQDVMRAYALSVRSTAPTVHMQGMMHALINCATACARLLLRTTVLPHPDCTVAIVLMEHTLTNKHSASALLSGGYLNLGLPSLADILAQGLSPTLDGGLQLLYDHARPQLVGGFGLCDRSAEDQEVAAEADGFFTADGPFGADHVNGRKPPRPFGPCIFTQQED